MSAMSVIWVSVTIIGTILIYIRPEDTWAGGIIFGALGAMISRIFGSTFGLQFAIFAGIDLSFAIIYKAIMRHIDKKLLNWLNEQNLTVIETIDVRAGTGEIKPSDYIGSPFAAAPERDDVVIPEGGLVRVVAMKTSGPPDFDLILIVAPILDSKNTSNTETGGADNGQHD